MPRELSRNKLDGCTVAVTGGAGFIGSHLVEHLLARGCRVRVIDDLSTGSHANLAFATNEPRLEFVEASVVDESAMHRALPGCDTIFHLATRSVRLSLFQPTIVHEVNVTGTLNVLKAAAAAGVRRFLYCSSSEVNGTADVVPMAEDYTFRPETIYGASKLAGEYYALVFHRSNWLPCVIARPHNNYGPRAHFKGPSGELIPRMVLLALMGKPLPVFGDGQQTRDFTYVGETVAHLAALIETDDALGQVFNVCRGEEVTVRRIAELILSLTSSRSRIEHLPPRRNDVLRLFGDATRLRGLLGHAPEFSIEEGLKRTVAWYRDNVPLDAATLAAISPTGWQEVAPEPWITTALSARTSEAAA